MHSPGPSASPAKKRAPGPPAFPGSLGGHRLKRHGHVSCRARYRDFPAGLAGSAVWGNRDKQKGQGGFPPRRSPAPVSRLAPQAASRASLGLHQSGQRPGAWRISPSRGPMRGNAFHMGDPDSKGKPPHWIVITPICPGRAIPEIVSPATVRQVIWFSRPGNRDKRADRLPAAPNGVMVVQTEGKPPGNKPELPRAGNPPKRSHAMPAMKKNTARDSGAAHRRAHAPVRAARPDPRTASRRPGSGRVGRADCQPGAC